jgi:pimeloyl-ACP methyl ester carboxylesterase
VNLAYDLYDKFKSDKSLVIAHGLFASKYSWRSVAKALNERIKHKVYVVDLRNHGDSIPYTPEMSYEHMAEDLKEFIQKTVLVNQNTNDVFVLGHSMGGKIFMTLSLLHVRFYHGRSFSYSLLKSVF